MGTRRLTTALACLVLATSTAISTAVPAHAADAGTVTVSYSDFNYFVTPTTLTASAGDTFTVANTMDSGSSSYVSLQDGSGAVTFAGDPCTANTDCRVVDDQGTATGTFTVVSPGTVTVWRALSGGQPVQRGTITIDAGGSTSASTPDPASVYPTAHLNANGGTCTGVLTFTKYQGENGTITLPDEAECTRPAYRLSYWTYGPSVPLAPWNTFNPGTTLPIGDESFTLYAEWVPLGAEITYDANVAAADPCLADGIDTATRTSVVVVEHPGTEYLQPSDGALAASAPCTPPGLVLAGWRVTSQGDGAKVYPAGTPVTDLFPVSQVVSTRVRLAAVWKVTYQLTADPTAATLTAGSSTTISLTARRNGAPATATEIAISVVGDVTLVIGATSGTVTTGADGTASVRVVAGSASASGSGTLTAAYGDTVTSVPITVRAPVSRSITITGARVTVSGKPGIAIEGTATGLEPGTSLVPWFKFPGATAFSESDSRIQVADDGTFTWTRKTGKKISVYVTDASGAVTSNRVTIAAS